MSAALKATPATFYVRKPQQHSAVAYLSCVRIERQAVTYDTMETISPGSVGTVVLVHDDGAAYDVEFEGPNGVATLAAEDLVALP